MRIIKFRYWEKPDASVNFEGKMHYDSDEYFNKWCGNPEYETMQFTGLLDRHGKEIYEGDIVRNTADKYHYEIKWDNFESAWSLGENGSPIRRYLLSEYWEVIGNIYENPELLQN